MNTATGLRETVWLVVCEPTPRWAPALKSLLARETTPDVSFRVLSPASLPTAESLTELRAPALVLAAVSRDHFSESLRWIAAARSQAVEIVAMPDSSLLGHTDKRVEQVLREAGAADVLRSTAELPRVLPLARRHTRGLVEQLDADSPLRASVWRRLPWQPVPGPLR